MDFSLLSDLWAISRTIPAERATHQEREGDHGELRGYPEPFLLHSISKSPEIKKKKEGSDVRSSPRL